MLGAGVQFARACHCLVAERVVTGARNSTEHGQAARERCGHPLSPYGAVACIRATLIHLCVSLDRRCRKYRAARAAAVAAEVVSVSVTCAGHGSGKE